MSAVDKNEKIGDGPIEPAFHKLLNAIAGGLDDVLNGDKTGADREVGFVLLVFPFTGPDGKKYEGRANYISNAKREDIVVLLKEQLARFEGWPEMEGHA